ncbi:MAG: hypothetical protein FWE72_04865 [Spirochaetaceae bacterium]|nr:hypothetical protein [Spirochaetaceae bacterium]
MGSEKQLCQELDTIISDINASGLSKITPVTMEKLEKVSAEAAELGMKAGKGLIDNFITVLKSFQAGKSNEDSVSLRLTALDFYKKNVLDNSSDSNVEEL